MVSRMAGVHGFGVIRFYQLFKRMIFAGHYDGHLREQALCVRWQNLLPIADDTLVGLAHGPDIAIQVVKA